MNPDFHDMLREFSEREVEYLLVGAYAVAVHGYPRATGDMDLLVHPTQANALRVVDALKAFGAPLANITAEDFTTPGIVYQVGREPNRIDVLTTLAGVTWDEAWAGRIYQDVVGLRVPVIGVDELCKSKRTVARPKDLADLAWFEEQRRLPSE